MPNQDDLIVVPLTTAKRKLLGVSAANARSVNSISVRVRDDADIKEGIDADLAKESAKLQSLQTKQQLGIQALSIANQSSSSILSLFR